jgi:GNAT superfamily N-acetyltransferase
LALHGSSYRRDDSTCLAYTLIAVQGRESSFGRRVPVMLSVSDVWLRSRRASRAIPPAAHTDDEVRAWFRDVGLPSREVWVTTDGANLTAMMVIAGEWLEQLCVAPEHSRQGYGSRLVRFAQSNRSELALWTFEANVSARAFYEKRGFLPAGAPSSENEEHTPAICYRWKSTASPPALATYRFHRGTVVRSAHWALQSARSGSSRRHVQGPHHRRRAGPGESVVW